MALPEKLNTQKPMAVVTLVRNNAKPFFEISRMMAESADDLGALNKNLRDGLTELDREVVSELSEWLPQA
jgi:hypothetical protein